jgi:MFS family permease
MFKRLDSVFVSCFLFTVTLLCLVPLSVSDALAGRDRVALQALDAGYQNAAMAIGAFGVASLAIILIGLIVTWAGYAKRLRWTWFVMFIIVCVWAFPVLILPILQVRKGILLTEWFQTAIREPSPYRDLAEFVLIFTLMVIALTLPIKAFFFKQENSRTQL